MKGKFQDLTGQRFGRLTVVGRADDYIRSDGKREIRWLCNCDCGNQTKVRTYNLTEENSKIKYCGKCQRNVNKYDLSGEYGIGWTSNTDTEFYFDLEDYDKIKDYCWYENEKGYILTNQKRKKVRLHRFILEKQNEPHWNNMVDHINHNKRDCRKINLRVATNSQNMYNKQIDCEVVGVRFREDKNRWEARIGHDGVIEILGLYINEKDAVAARKKAEEKYFGEFSYENSMRQAEEYKIEGE